MIDYITKYTGSDPIDSAQDDPLFIFIIRYLESEKWGSVRVNFTIFADYSSSVPSVKNLPSIFVRTYDGAFLNFLLSEGLK